MRKRVISTITATLLAIGSAFGGSAASARPDAVIAIASPTTTNSDDSCDIGVYPAATLLLPYFEVDLTSPQTTARTTLFTIVNVTRFPQIAHCTVWSDWGFPVLDVNIFLTGYDVQAINLYDVLARGVIAPPGGTSNGTTPGSLSAANNANPNFAVTAATTCSQLPGADSRPDFEGRASRSDDRSLQLVRQLQGWWAAQKRFRIRDDRRVVDMFGDAPDELAVLHG